MAGARLEHSVQQDLIGTDIQACTVKQLQNQANILLIPDLLQGLHHDR
eukprot:CAMPEP_0172707264 /NCGR_PEP_ID=MMETSP1074-20121228/49106_1 /TAXON_ID=2916 /ORGANISM="Ceratium fusus, Strain PA161109" /LENGTH=47 /DNA_ID= /DNA_START= /DNA_END= /DNA_ORIENTATION=